MAAVIVLIVCASVLGIVIMGIRHSENMERIKHGYPLRDGSMPGRPKAAKGEPEAVDLRDQYQKIV